MKIQSLDKAKKKKIIEGLSSLGITKIPQLLIRSGKERIRAYSGNLSKEEIMDIWKILPIEGIGLYVAKEMINRHGVREIRPSIDGLHAWKKQITNNIIELNEELEEEWFKGKNLDYNTEKTKNIQDGTYVAIISKTSKDIIGTGKIGNNNTKIYNYLPKERRRKSQTL